MAKHENVTPVEMLKARCTMTETGHPANLAVVVGCYGARVNPAIEDGWFWIGATAASAANVRRRGLRVVGSVMTTWIPPQDAPVVHDVPEESVPVVGTQAHTDLMIEETRAA